MSQSVQWSPRGFPFVPCPQNPWHYMHEGDAECDLCVEERRRNGWAMQPTMIITASTQGMAINTPKPLTCQDCGKTDECVTLDLPWCFTCHARLSRRYGAFKAKVLEGRCHEFDVPHPDEDPYGWFQTHLHETGTFGCWCPTGFTMEELAEALRAKGAEL